MKRGPEKKLTNRRAGSQDGPGSWDRLADPRRERIDRVRGNRREHGLATRINQRCDVDARERRSTDAYQRRTHYDIRRVVASGFKSHERSDERGLAPCRWGDYLNAVAQLLRPRIHW